jgi:hypothetical protein
MKTTIKTFFLLLLISFSGSVFAQNPCSYITNQINVLKINIEKDRNVLAKLEATLRSNPRNLAKIQPQINKKINEIEFQKTKKKKLQDQYEDCLVKNKIANNKEDAKVVASTEKKMAKNAEIKKGNAVNKHMDDIGQGDGNFVPKDKVQYTPAELAAKKKIKQDARNAESRAKNETAAVKAWKEEFRKTKDHTLQHTLKTIQLETEFEKFIKIEYSEENLYFYQNIKLPPANWNLKLIKSKYLDATLKKVGEAKDSQINLPYELQKSLNREIIASNFVANPQVIKLMYDAQGVIFKLMLDTFARFKPHMETLAKTKNTKK